MTWIKPTHVHEGMLPTQTYIPQYYKFVYKGKVFRKTLNRSMCKLKNKWLIKIKCMQMLIKVTLFVLIIHTGS